MSLGNLVYPFRLVGGGREGRGEGGQVGAGLSLGFTSNRVPGPSQSKEFNKFYPCPLSFSFRHNPLD